jgi:hypothetical protein
MKKFFVLALSALMVAAFAVPSFAKVNLSGAIWATYWAQQQGELEYEAWVGSGWTTVRTVPAAAANLGYNVAQPSKKTFIVGQEMNGNGVQQKVTAGDGFLLALDCPVNDWVKAYGEVDVLNAGNLQLQQGYINLAFMKELNVRAGLMQVPFGYEPTQRPTVGNEEVFVSAYSQQARGALQRQYDIGVQALGTLANGMVDYNLVMTNGAINMVAGAQNNNQNTPDTNDAKMYGVNLCFKPFTGAFVGGSYFAGDQTLNVGTVNLVQPIDRGKFTAYDINAGYEYGNIFSISGEYATTRADLASAEWLNNATFGTTRVAQRVNEYILKAIYTGVADWEFGVRYGVVDPKNIEAEIAAGFSAERKTSFAVGYKFARAAFLKAEYSILNTNFNYATNANIGNSRQNPVKDINDNIAALSLGLQF